MSTDNSRSPKKGITVLFWTGIVLALMGIASTWVAETFMADNLQGQKGVLIFYRTFGPFLPKRQAAIRRANEAAVGRRSHTPRPEGAFDEL